MGPGQLGQTIKKRHRVNVRRTLLKQFLEEDVKETAVQVVGKGECQASQPDLAEGKSTFTTDNECLVDALTETGRQEVRGFSAVLTAAESNGADGFFIGAGVAPMTKFRRTCND
jgi:hypothetical protein